jgi:RimJ/RimL family protein N-acetyltransferase
MRHAACANLSLLAAIQNVVVMKTLYSQNLILRPLERADFPELSRMLGDPETTKYLFGGKPLSSEQAKDFITTEFSSDEDDGFGMGTVVDTATDSFIGFAGLITSAYPGGEDLELGFAKASWARRSKFGQEIGKRQIVFGFDELNRDRLLALVHPENGHSLHILKENLRMKWIDKITTNERGPREVFSLDRASYLQTAAYYRQ